MKFNEEYFDAGLYRCDTRSEKWDGCRSRKGENTLPMWVADMDFPSPPAAQEAILRRAAHPTYCYTEILEDDHQAVCDFWQRRHGVSVTADQVTMLPCVVTGLKVMIRAFTKPGDGVIIQSPVYGPFRFSVEATDRRLMDCPRLHMADGSYGMDYAAIEKALQNGARVMLLCNPHNPVSRLWSKAELERLSALLKQYDALLVSDEIHADFVYPTDAFVSALSISGARTIVLCAASKTFNLAGLQQASCLCPDDDLRGQLRAELNATGVVSGNIFALEATRAAYQEGDDWLDGLISYLDGNRGELAGLIAEYLPKAVLSPISATYLAWIDLSAWGYPCEELEKRLDAAGVAFTMGTFFGETGEYHVRLNFACPRRYLKEGVLRLKKALEG